MKNTLLSLIAVSLIAYGFSGCNGKYNNETPKAASADEIVGKTVQSIYVENQEVIIGFTDGKLLVVKGYKYNLEVILK